MTPRTGLPSANEMDLLHQRSASSYGLGTVSALIALAYTTNELGKMYSKYNQPSCIRPLVHQGVTMATALSRRGSLQVAKPIESDRASTVFAVVALWACDEAQDVTQDWDKVTSRLLEFLLTRVDRQIQLRRNHPENPSDQTLLGEVLTILVTGTTADDASFAESEQIVLDGLGEVIRNLLKQKGQTVNLEQLRKVTRLLYVTDAVLMTIINSSRHPAYRRDPLSYTRAELGKLCRLAHAESTRHLALAP